VTEREWPHVWLSEGFATYFAALWAESSRGDTALRAELAKERRKVLAAAVTVQKPVIDESLDDLSRVLNSNVYEKASLVLHMLRREVGDSAFFRGIRAYYAKYRHGNALTDDFRHEVEAASGQPLDWFFDQWMRRPGFAELSISWTWDRARNALLLTVSQGSRFAPYRLQLPVEMVDPGGTHHRTWVTVPASRVATVQVPLTGAGAPTSVTFDPDGDLLARITVK
jgi:aminopeptidase N